MNFIVTQFGMPFTGPFGERRVVNRLLFQDLVGIQPTNSCFFPEYQTQLQPGTSCATSTVSPATRYGFVAQTSPCPGSRHRRGKNALWHWHRFSLSPG
jgi:hypothetical protein